MGRWTPAPCSSSTSPLVSVAIVSLAIASRHLRLARAPHLLLGVEQPREELTKLVLELRGVRGMVRVHVRVRVRVRVGVRVQV